MSRRLLAALVVLAPLTPPALSPARTRLKGQFAMSGRITIARNVPGEYVGERVTRIWDFLAPCPAGQCATEQLVRARAMGQDKLTLKRPRRPVLYDHWVGRGSFFAPLSCGTRVYPRGQRIWFTIAVRISGVTPVNGMPVATSVKASYRDYRRTNLTPCFAVLGQDAAVYSGSLVTPPTYP